MNDALSPGAILPVEKMLLGKNRCGRNFSRDVAHVPGRFVVIVATGWKGQQPSRRAVGGPFEFDRLLSRSKNFRRTHCQSTEASSELELLK